MSRAPVSRLPHWRARLDAVVARHHSQEFAWGSYDCAHWAADGVEAVTGIDVLGTLRNGYDSRLSCLLRLKHRGYRGFLEAADGLLAKVGASRICPTEAIYGDIGMSADYALLINLQPGFVGRKSSTFVAVPIRGVSYAWRIGR